MTQSDRPEQDETLQVLKQAAQAAPKMPEGLVARVIADAERLQPRPIVVPARQPSRGLTRLLEALGGWPAVSGFAAASCAGFWVGFAPPDGLIDASEVLFNSYSETVYDDAAELSGFGWDLDEG